MLTEVFLPNLKLIIVFSNSCIAARLSRRQRVNKRVEYIKIFERDNGLTRILIAHMLNYCQHKTCTLYMNSHITA